MRKIRFSFLSVHAPHLSVCCNYDVASPVLEHEEHFGNFGAHFRHQAHLVQAVEEVNLRGPEVSRGERITY